jgi:hypothetical protein
MQKLKVFVFSHNRPNSITTSPLLTDEDIDHVLLLHNKEQEDNYLQANRVKPDNIVVTNQPRGLSYNRNIALEMMEDDEWALFLVDDMKSVTELLNHHKYVENFIPIDMDNQNDWKFKFKEPLTLNNFINRAKEMTEFCDSVNSKLGGFCGIDNPPFRKKHYTFNTFADGRAWVVKKSQLRFDTNVHCIDDYAWNALNLKEFGITVVNQWVLPDFERYTPGGLGTLQERSEQKIKECAYLVENYPQYFAYKEKPGQASLSHITLRPQRKPNWLTPDQLGKPTIHEGDSPEKRANQG